MARPFSGAARDPRGVSGLQALPRRIGGPPETGRAGLSRCQNGGARLVPHPCSTATVFHRIAAPHGHLSALWVAPARWAAARSGAVRVLCFFVNVTVSHSLREESMRAGGGGTRTWPAPNLRLLEKKVVQVHTDERAGEREGTTVAAALSLQRMTRP